MAEIRSENEVIETIISNYKMYGYKLYKPGSFEDYSLYQENKDFLIGKNVISFSDLSGRLMAMRPDVTLSLIKHSDVKQGEVEKYYYNEKVYRRAGGKEFKEISQTGVEVVGDIDGISIAETVVLACKTLSAISENYILDISHMGVTEGLLSLFGEGKSEVAECLKNKNLHDFYKLCEKYGYSDNAKQAFVAVSGMSGSPKKVLKNIGALALNKQMASAVEELTILCKRLCDYGLGDKINIDFSVSNNADYYNGVVFCGYINGIYHRVLSGGRYDKLLDKMGKCGGAVGFALYLGELDRFFKKGEDKVDYLVIYNDRTAETALSFAKQKIEGGASVRICKSMPKDIKFDMLIDLIAGAEK